MLFGLELLPLGAFELELLPLGAFELELLPLGAFELLLLPFALVGLKLAVGMALTVGSSEGALDGVSDGRKESDGVDDGPVDGDNDGTRLGPGDGPSEGIRDGKSDGLSLGMGDMDGSADFADLGDLKILVFGLFVLLSSRLMVPSSYKLRKESLPRRSLVDAAVVMRVALMVVETTCETDPKRGVEYVYGF